MGVCRSWWVKLYPWGDEFLPGGKWMANTWQGRFPVEDTGEDGFKGIARWVNTRLTATGFMTWLEMSGDGAATELSLHNPP